MSSHQTFAPLRQHTLDSGRTSSAKNFGTTRNGPQTWSNAPLSQQQQSKPSGSLGERLGGASTIASTQPQREAQRLERERQERAEKERREAEERVLLVDQLSEEQREEVNEAFSLFDLDKDGHIGFHELKVALKSLGFDLPRSEIYAFFQCDGVPASSLTQNSTHRGPQSHPGDRPSFTGSGRLLLSHLTFQHIAASKILAREPEEEIVRAFELYDTKGKGWIDVEDLKRVARSLGEGIQDEELQAMIDEFDIKGDGGIDLDTFLSICMG
ncbi:Calcium-binding component of the spindle pole body (SPB) half-bridge [Recurvomyces mirabilis]|nr:Calcium-binding component of the spindle pole body (SPB) half-bridge [Recurvomyces mirabilis]